MSANVDQSSKEPRLSGVWKSSHDIVIDERHDNVSPVLPKLHPHGFPQAPFESQCLPRSSGKKNVSLFASRRKRETKPDAESVPDCQSISKAVNDIAEGYKESDDIESSAAQDAVNLFNNMDDEQRREYREMLMQTLPKELVEKWTKRSNIVKEPSDQRSEESIQSQHHLSTEWMSPITDQDLIVNQDHRDLPIRFGFNGEIIPSDRDISVLEGLHHHGREAGLAGYTIAELCLLLRSTVASQRIAALGVVVAILRRLHEESLFRNERSQSDPVTPSCRIMEATSSGSSCTRDVTSSSSNETSLNSLIWTELVSRQKIYLLLRTSLDTDNVHQICLSLEALFFLIAPADLFQRLDEFDYEGGHFLNPVASSSDFLQKLSGFLLVERLRYLVEISGSYHVGIRHAALDLLIAIAGYSSEMAMRIAECPRMLTVLNDFIRRAFDIDYVTLLASLRLMRLLAQSDRDIAYAISASLRSDLEAILLNPPQTSLVLECIRISAVFRLYDPESSFFEIPSKILNDLNSIDSKLQRSLVKLIAQNPGNFAYDVQNFIDPDCSPAILRLIPNALVSLESDKDTFASTIAKRWRRYWESCFASFLQMRHSSDRQVNADCHLYVFRGLIGDSITDDMCLIVKSFLALRCGALADILHGEGYIDDFRRLASFYRSCPTAVNAIDGPLFANLILILNWIGDDVIEDALILPTLSFPGSEPGLYQIIASGMCTFDSADFRALLRVVWLGSLCTDWSPTSLYAAPNSQLPLPSDWVLSSTLESLQNSGDDFALVIVPRLQSLMATWQRLSLSKSALFQALLRVFAFGCEVFLASAIEPRLRALLQSCFKDVSFSISVDKSLVSHVASVFAEESFGSGVFASCLMAILAHRKTELKLALCGALGASTMSRLRCYPDPIPFAACDYLYPPETDADLLLFYRNVLFENAENKDSWIYILAIHHTYCSFFDHEDRHNAPILEICSFIHDAPKEVLMDVLSYQPPSPSVRSFFKLDRQQISAHVTDILKLAIENNSSVQRVLSEKNLVPFH